MIDHANLNLVLVPKEGVEVELEAELEAELEVELGVELEVGVVVVVVVGTVAEEICVFFFSCTVNYSSWK